MAQHVAIHMSVIILEKLKQNFKYVIYHSKFKFGKYVFMYLFIWFILS